MIYHRLDKEKRLNLPPTHDSNRVWSNAVPVISPTPKGETVIAARARRWNNNNYYNLYGNDADAVSSDDDDNNDDVYTHVQIRAPKRTKKKSIIYDSVRANGNGDDNVMRIKNVNTTKNVKNDLPQSTNYKRKIVKLKTRKSINTKRLMRK
jgi:hypothetical protein